MAGIYIHTDRSRRLLPAHQGMKIEPLVGGIVREAFVPPLRPLDSEFRRKDEIRGRECRSGVAVWTYVVVSRIVFIRGMLVRGFPPSRE